MTSLLNVIDTDKYDISLLLISPTGELMPLIPKSIKIISNSVLSALTSRFDGFTKLIKLGKPVLAVMHVVRLLLSRINRSYAGRFLAWLMPPIEGEYDMIIDYNGQHQLYYMVNKLCGKKKVTFFHSDYSKWPYYYNADKKYFPKVDAIFTISDTCVESLKKYFPKCKSKIIKMENISSPILINKLAQEPIELPPFDGITLVTIGHVCYNKGIDLAIEAASILTEKNLNFRWVFVGKVLANKYMELIKDFRLDKRMIFVGAKVNPYPYIYNADIVVHPSRFEGRSIALDEVKILCKPVVVTNFSTVNDQFKNGYNASICEMNGEAIANSIIELYSNHNLMKQYSANLKEHIVDNSSEVYKLNFV
jgi:glycosyltransferase involved in cell wall biosynthesis